MNRYIMSFYYMATGMDSPIQKQYGIREADSENTAKDIIIKEEYPQHSKYEKMFFKGCISAKLICH